MARIKLGATVVGIRGTIGGITFSANKSGPFARQWSKPSNPRSSGQGANRALLSTHGPYWQALSAGDRADWDTYAAGAAQELTDSLGEAYYASGWNWYCNINQHQIESNRARRDTYPTVAAPAAPTIASVVAQVPITVEADVRATFAAGHFNGFVFVWEAAWGSGLPEAPMYRGFRLVYTYGTSGWTTNDCGVLLVARLGQPTVGSTLYSVIYKQSEQGRRGAPTTINTTVVAK